MRSRNLRIAVMLAAAAVGASAQWVKHPTPGIPRTPEGKPNLSAPPPRASNGKPDLSGIWQAEAAPIPDLIRLLPGGVNGLGEATPSKYFLNILADFKPDEAPLQPAAAAALRKLNPTPGGKDAPITRCLPAGIPLADVMPAPFKIIQTPGLMAVLYEQDTFRQVFLDGRAQPEDPQPGWMGNSVGQWEGDTLVVHTQGFNDKSWLDVSGHTHSEAMQLTESFHRRDFGHMEAQITVDDPKTYTKPFTINFNLRLLPDTDLIEFSCTENEKDVSHLSGK
jgi:hypothetical protein